jgi:hypothetical protein
MGSEMRAIEKYFNSYFSNWDIRLPREAISHRRSGHIFERGWHIGFIWGREAGEEYLEFLAQHRMTNDRRQRVYESGRVENLEAASTVLPEGGSPEEESRPRGERRRASADHY